MPPLVSIIIPVYNAHDYITECIESIINQTHTSIEIIIIDDASTDDSLEIVRSFNDIRLRIIRNEKNLGLATSVNNAIKISQGAFIARMDADDIAFPQRIEKQLSFLLSNPTISILGTAMQSIGHSDYLHQFPLTHSKCKVQLLFNVCFGHPTVMFRKSVFDSVENYYQDELQQYSEEYELWCRLVDRVTFANLPEALILYRTFDNKERMVAVLKRKHNSFLIRKKFITTQLGELDKNSFHIHDQISNLEKVKSYEQLNTWIYWLDKIDELNKNVQVFSKRELTEVLLARKFELHYWNSQLGFISWFRSVTRNLYFWRQPFRKQLYYLFKSIFRL